MVGKQPSGAPFVQARHGLVDSMLLPQGAARPHLSGHVEEVAQQGLVLLLGLGQLGQPVAHLGDHLPMEDLRDRPAQSSAALGTVRGGVLHAEPTHSRDLCSAGDQLAQPPPLPTHQEVHRALWRDVPERERLVVLVDDLCWDLLGDDLVKDGGSPAVGSAAGNRTTAAALVSLAQGTSEVIM